MKVLYATMQFGRGYAQGTERYVAMLADGLRRRGHEAAVIAGDPEQRGPRLSLGQPFQDEPRVLFCPTRGWLSVGGLSARRWRPLLERERPDVLHIANPAHIGLGVAAAARQLGLPVVVTVMDYWWLCPKHTLLHYAGGICSADVPWQECVRCIGAGDPRAAVRTLAALPVARATALPALYFARAICRGSSPADLSRWTHRQAYLLAALDQADAVIFPSRGARAHIAPRLRNPQVHSIPYGLEPRWFEAHQPATRDAGPRDPARLTLGFAGALAPHKGPHLLLQAAAELGWKATQVRLAGGGRDAAYRERLRALAKGLNVEFVGLVPSEDMPAFLRGLDLLVVPSIWPENLPIILLEAQAVGIPVLASRIDGVTEAISDPALLFEVNSAASLAECLESWAKAGHAFPSSQMPSTADEMVEKMLAVYEALCGPHEAVRA